MSLPPGVSESDVAAVTAQLGRRPRAVRAVAHRCPCGLPSVVQTAPRLPDGTPFPTLYYLTHPVLTAAATAVVFLYAFLRVGRGRGLTAVRGRMAAAVALLVAAYLAIGAFPGFSILLGAAILVAIYGLFDPGFGADPRGTLEG